MAIASGFHLVKLLGLQVRKIILLETSKWTKMSKFASFEALVYLHAPSNHESGADSTSETDDSSSISPPCHPW
jgi:hypothetical protein